MFFMVGKLVEMIDVSVKHGPEYNAWLQSLIGHVNRFYQGKNQNFAQEAGISKTYLSEILKGKKTPEPLKKHGIDKAIVDKLNREMASSTPIVIPLENKMDEMLSLMRQLVDVCSEMKGRLAPMEEKLVHIASLRLIANNSGK